MAEGEVRRAKLFANGRSQAVRLPLEFRFEGKEVLIRREGDRVILEPVSESESMQPESAQEAAGKGERLDAARAELERLGPVSGQFAAMLEEALRKVKG